MRTSSVDLLILEIVANEHDHFTSQEIYEKLRISLPAINRSTVYRSLDRLVNNGKVSISDLNAGAMVYQAVGTGKHHHLICQNCHQIIKISDVDVEEFFQKIEKQSKYKIITNHLILYGTCENCGSGQ